MKAIFNSRIIESSEHLLKTDNRSFCYGDGLFETIVTGPRRINLIEKNQQRLAQGCEVLGIEFPEPLKGKGLEEMIQKLIDKNRLEGDVRARLTVWRNTGGLYKPDRSDSSYYLEVKATDKPIYAGLGTIGCSQDYHTILSPISFAKTTNALVYVLAGKEMASRNLDEIILTDVYGNLAETHLSNLFWIKDDQIFTPPLETGCIAGIMRACIMDFFESEGKSVLERKITTPELSKASSIFTTNASGIRYFSQLEGSDELYENPIHHLTNFIKRLQQP